ARPRSAFLPLSSALASKNFCTACGFAGGSASIVGLAASLEPPPHAVATSNTHPISARADPWRNPFIAHLALSPAAPPHWPCPCPCPCPPPPLPVAPQPQPAPPAPPRAAATSTAQATASPARSRSRRRSRAAADTAPRSSASGLRAASASSD